MNTIAAYTLGCKVNQYDTEAMLEQFESAGWRRVDFADEADVYLINTCTVTGTGDNKSMKLIRRILRERPQSGVIVAGCLAQRDADRVSLPGVRLVIGTARRSECYALYSQAVGEGIQLRAVGDIQKAGFEPMRVTRHEGFTRAYMKIQEGCDRYCAYCAIPYVRGRPRSMPMDRLTDEANALGEEGYKEIVLTGIHLASFGRDTGATLPQAIEAAAGAEGVLRVRLGSLEPVTVTEDFARFCADTPKLARQFHLSLQSGSGTVLRRMNRRYTPDEYLRAVDTLRKHMPLCAVTTDVICGFPGETEEEFKESCGFVEKAQLSRVHVFPYSRRSGTRADKMPGQLTEAVKRDRARELISIGNRLEQAYVQRFVGLVREVLFETAQDGSVEGYTGEYVRTRAHGNPGEMRPVHMDEAQGTLLVGTALRDR